MNKTELIEKIAKKADMSKAQAARAVDAFTESISDALKSGDKVALIGFGTFEGRQRAARQGRNPQTGKTLEIKARRVPAFTAGKTLKDLVA